MITYTYPNKYPFFKTLINVTSQCSHAPRPDTGERATGVRESRDWRHREASSLRSASGRVAESVCGCAVGSAWVWVFGAGLLKTPTVAGGGANETNYIVCELFANAAASSVPKFHSAKPDGAVRSGRIARSRRKRNLADKRLKSLSSRLLVGEREPKSKARTKPTSQRVASVASVGTSVLGEQPKHEHHGLQSSRCVGELGHKHSNESGEENVKKSGKHKIHKIQKINKNRPKTNQCCFGPSRQRNTS